MTLRSYCFRCGGPQEDPRATLCRGCTTARDEARENVMQSGREQIEAEQDPKKKQWMQNILEQEADKAAKEALASRSHHAHRNFVDPRDFSAGRGMIPVPPQTDRGNPA